jgi:hypothetical protein
VACRPGQYQLSAGKTFCVESQPGEYVLTGADGTTATHDCPKAGLEDEFSCVGGVLVYDKQGYWHDGMLAAAAAPDKGLDFGIATSPHDLARHFVDRSTYDSVYGTAFSTRPEYTVSVGTKFYKCRSASDCVVEPVNGSVTCAPGSRGVLCATCQHGWEYSTLAGGKCVQCPSSAELNLVWPLCALAFVALALRQLWWLKGRQLWLLAKTRALNGQSIEVVVLFKIVLGR